MAPKKKGKDKGKKDGESKDLSDKITEWDNLDIPALHTAIDEMKNQLSTLRKKRNYSQVECDAVKNYYDVTTRDIKNTEATIYAVDREIERLEEDHRVEVRVYVHKVRHLNYEHDKNLKRIECEAASILQDESQNFENRTNDLTTAKVGLKGDLREKRLVHAEDVEALRKDCSQSLAETKRRYETDLDDVKKRCEARLVEMEHDLELRRKLEIHDVEERKHMYINETVKKHNAAIEKLKDYYKDIIGKNTSDVNLLKADLAERERKVTRAKERIDEISKENERLEEPLQVAINKVKKLRDETKNQEKDRLSLRNTKARLSLSSKRLHALSISHSQLQSNYDAAVRDRDLLYQRFETSVSSACETNRSKNLILDHRLKQLQRDNDVAAAQLEEVVTAAAMDFDEAQQITVVLGELLTEKNLRIEKLRIEVAKAKKRYEERVRRVRERLLEMGVEEGDVLTLGVE